MGRPLASVVVIFLNAARFLREAIASVYAQTYSDWELLLVDDGSTDASPQIAREQARQDPDRVRYLEHSGHQNRGMSASRNLGIGQASGDFIAFLDADDEWLPEKLERQIDILERHPDAGMVYGPGLYWFSWSGLPHDRTRDVVQEVGVADSLIRPPALVPIYLQRPEATPSPSGVLVGRSTLCDVGGFEESFRGMYEDQAFCTKVALVSPVYVSASAWYRYRQHDDSCCSIAFGDGSHFAARLRFLDWVERRVATLGVRDDEIERALQHELAAARIANGVAARVRRAVWPHVPGRLRRWIGRR